MICSHNRDVYTRLTDQLLTLYVGSKVKELKSNMGIVKLQKILFLSQSEMVKEGIDGLHHQFVKDKQGARSNGVYRDRGHLARLNLFNEESTEITKVGIDYVKMCQEIFEDNQLILDYIDGILYEVGKMNSIQITSYGHEYMVEFDGKTTKVDDIPMGEIILQPLEEDEIINGLSMSEEWAESLRAMFNIEYMGRYQEVINQMQHPRYQTHEEVFGHAPQI